MSHLKPLSKVQFLDLNFQESHSHLELFEGMSKPQKQIHPKFLYDPHGSHLFEKICDLAEYYPTRTEISILQKAAPEIGSLLGPRCFILEFGVGSGIKTRALLKSLIEPIAYAPIDISMNFLLESAQKLNEEFPNIPIFPILADFTYPIQLPCTLKNPGTKRVAFFPGSSLGNFEPTQAKLFLRQVARLIGVGGIFIVGIDLVKDFRILESAYNDSLGVTAAFNLNILTRMNRELDAHFDLSAFSHKAFYHREHKRVEMHLVSLRDQIVPVKNTSLSFRQGETIHTENSYKFDLEEFEDFIENLGYSQLKLWTDPKNWFAVSMLEVNRT